jgi:hypothetical protein
MQATGCGENDHDPDTDQQSEFENGGITLAGWLIAQPHPGNNRDHDGNKR